MFTKTRRLPFRMVFLCGSVWLGGCLGIASGPSGEKNPPHPIHGSWYSQLASFGGPVASYYFYEYEYRPDSRFVSRFHNFHRDSLTDHLVFDSISEPSFLKTYSLDGDIVTENTFNPAGDTLMYMMHYRYAIGGDSLDLRPCTVLSGTGTSLEGHWETRLPSYSGPIRVVVEFRDGMRYDSSYLIGRPPEAAEPRAYRPNDDSSFTMVDPVDSSLETLGYRIRRNSLVILQFASMVPMFRNPPALIP
jgi:hypothetical protein